MSAHLSDDLASFYDGLVAQLDDRAAALRQTLAQTPETEPLHDELRGNHKDLLAHRENIHASAIRLHNTHRSPPLAFPVELLCAVFQAVVGEVNSMWDDWNLDYKLDGRRRAAPFTLASVCRRWRAIVLSTPSLWYYIAIPPAQCTEDYNKSHAYVDTVLDRSGETALQITINWDPFDEQWGEVHANVHNEALVCRLAEAAHRWKVVFMASLDATEWRRYVGHCAMPMLEELVIRRTDGGRGAHWEFDVPSFLSTCQNLRRVRVDDLYVVSPPCSTPIQNLVVLDLEFLLSASVQMIWDLLQVLPRLEILCINLWTDPGWDWHRTPQILRLARLRVITIRHWAQRVMEAWVAHLELPQLQSCVLGGRRPRDLTAFFATFANRVLTLTIEDMDDDLKLETLIEFRRLKVLILTHPGAAYAEIFSSLADSTGIWPALETVVLRGLTITEQVGGALIRLIRSRHPSRLKHVRLEQCRTPGWFDEQLPLFLRDPEIDIPY
ncbi:hypothetical protein EXIGLDRAFT_841229 [Exidia glandulosa HHB12029]|uniref:Uncharacterized protein n=1 Tax=Exidia glandulosa HHB12029 TaxID=1314781 RepID=A0A165DZZ2_EXIGL|nr:hypothetical protein EXIGLDRAFT_841229 [Exidia glandulosa HHB12029]